MQKIYIFYEHNLSESFNEPTVKENDTLVLGCIWNKEVSGMITNSIPSVFMRVIRIKS